ncbi:DUF2267 domain-containing protein [Actinokineospora xionganensis]|uniref:DUF2267 domain-containing protein n=1 Tax=Actinokineospora xionganensis TaxID=2684470 RepID=A0ABR7L132_9PSEU|nr:DUF2267 domain-containing protein [Actinokineospora xionganensis]MBC6446149.1 DUF2267 domain-containing protein [Actinokineospora xionganensis]
MKEHEILAAVRAGGDLAESDQADVATHATLEVLACRLKGGDVPAGIAEALPSVTQGEEFGLEEFYRRVAEAEGETSAQGPAREHARAVIAALKSGVSEGDFDDLAARLPADYREDLLSTSAPNN